MIVANGVKATPKQAAKEVLAILLDNELAVWRSKAKAEEFSDARRLVEKLTDREFEQVKEAMEKLVAPFRERLEW